MPPSRDATRAARVLHGHASTVAPYDFRRPTKLSREHMRMLQMAYDTFARRMTTLLTSSLRQLCQVTHVDIEQQSYEEYVTGLEPQTLMAMLEVPPLQGTGILQFSLPIALAAIDHMLGGPGGAQLSRPLTDVEMVLVRGLLEQIVGTLQYSFESVVPIRAKLNDIEYNPQFAQAASASDSVVVAKFDMVVGSEQCRATLCLPLAQLLPRLTTHRPRGEGPDETGPAGVSAVQRLRDRLGEVPLEVNVRFTPAALSTEAILALSVGDVIPLRHRVGAPLGVEAAGETFAHAIAGRAGQRLAALIVTNPQERS